MRNERVIVVFVASPSDLEQERNQLEEVIDELNMTWSRKMGARFELVRWETHAYPAIGIDAQDVINQQLPYDYDIFIGLMWGRFGTPTGRAHSGTEEEFVRALERFRTNPEKVKIMLYFKDAPLPPSSIDPDQLQKIQNFKRSVGAEGTLYWNFRSTDDFGDLVRLHLSRQLQELSGFANPQQAGSALQNGVATPPEENELGIIDLLDLVELHFDENNQILGRMSAETETLGERMSKRAKEIELITSQKNGARDHHYVKQVVEMAAADMNRFVNRIRVDLPLFRESLHKSADAAAQVLLMGAEMNQKDRTGARTAMTALGGLANSIKDAHSSVGGFRSIVSSLPRMSSVLNRAKRATVEVLDEIMKTLEEGRNLLLEAAKSIQVLADEMPWILRAKAASLQPAPARA